MPLIFKKYDPKIGPLIDIGVSASFGDNLNYLMKPYTALIDTGADSTLISRKDFLNTIKIMRRSSSL